MTPRRSSSPLLPFAVGVTLMLSGCALFRSPSTPMPVVAHPSASPAPRPLVVLLPGFGDGPEDFLDHGFVAELQALGCDVAATDAHFGYYRGFTVVERLRKDVIVPARARGVTQIWLVGISMGGFGAVSYALRYPDEITGVIALAPYLGASDVPDAVREAGGLRAWRPGDASEIADDEDRHTHKLWALFKSYAEGRGDKPQLVLGWGDEDRIGRAARLVADVLPAEQVLTGPGGHKWVTWRPLFVTLAHRFLATAGSR